MRCPCHSDGGRGTYFYLPFIALYFFKQNFCYFLRLSNKPSSSGKSSVSDFCNNRWFHHPHRGQWRWFVLLQVWRWQRGRFAWCGLVEFLFGHCSSVVAIIEVYYCFSPFAVPYFCWASCLLILSMSPIVSQVVPDFLAAATASFTRFWADSCSRWATMSCTSSFLYMFSPRLGRNLEIRFLLVVLRRFSYRYLILWFRAFMAWNTSPSRFTHSSFYGVLRCLCWICVRSDS